MIWGLLLVVLASSPARAVTSFGPIANQTVAQSTSGVIGSVSQGNTFGKTTVFVSSSAAAAANGATVVLSSRTTTIGKTFYIQHVDVWGYLSAPSTTAVVNMGSVTMLTPTGAAPVVVATMTLLNQLEPSPRWVLDFAEPVPIASNVTFALSVKTNTAVAVTWVSNIFGYEK